MSTSETRAHHLATRYTFAMTKMVVALLLASLSLNAWFVLRAPKPEPTAVPPAASPIAERSVSDEPVAAMVEMLQAVRAARPAPAAVVDAGVTARRPLSDGYMIGRVDRALLDDLQCRIAKEKATEAWRKEADGIRRSLLDAPVGAEARAAALPKKRSLLADVIGVDEGDARLEGLSEKLVTLEDTARTELQRQLQKEPPDWRAAFDVVRGFYREHDFEVLRAFGPEAADDVRFNDVDARAAILAIGASLAGAAWQSVDDRTPPALP